MTDTNPFYNWGRMWIFRYRGVYLSALDEIKVWEFTPSVKAGDKVEAGEKIGFVEEGIFNHWIMVPFQLEGVLTVKSIVAAGSFTVNDTVAELEDEKGDLHSLTMRFNWPVKRAIKCYAERLKPSETLITKLRIIDTFIPVAKGGTYCIPGPFGAGKTVLQQVTSRHAEVDIVIIAACGERAGEVVETLKEFPELIDPKTGRSLMERTIIICNTSSMPVAAREASVYTAVSIAEYYRQMGLHVLLLADSTSRWAQAMREMSGRLEEIPGEEAFPAYLESLIAAFMAGWYCPPKSGILFGNHTAPLFVSPCGATLRKVDPGFLKVWKPFTACPTARMAQVPCYSPLVSWSKNTRAH